MGPKSPRPKFDSTVELTDSESSRGFDTTVELPPAPPPRPAFDSTVALDEAPPTNEEATPFGAPKAAEASGADLPAATPFDEGGDALETVVQPSANFEQTVALPADEIASVDAEDAIAAARARVDEALAQKEAERAARKAARDARKK